MQRPDFLDEYHGVWNHRRLDCLFHIMFRRTTKKISKLCIAAPFVMGIQKRLVESPHKRPTMLLVLTWWRYQMETFSAMLALCAGNSPVNGEFPTKRPVTPMFFFMFSLICAWTNGWVNSQDAGDLRRHRAHYDVNVMRSSWNPLLVNCVWLGTIARGMKSRANICRTNHH